jgi:hypothetical protein
MQFECHYYATHIFFVCVWGVLFSTSWHQLCLQQDGMTPLHIAAKNGHVDVVVALLEGKANVAATEKVQEQWGVRDCGTLAFCLL